MKKENVIIIFMAAVMLFSVFATGLLVFIDSSSDETGSAQDEISLEKITGQEAEVCSVSEENSTNTGSPVGDWPYVVEGEITELVSEDLRVGEGAEASEGDCITVHYRLALADGTPVAGNDTFDAGSPIAFDLIQGGLIDGWVQGIPGMKVGGVRRLTIPPELGYGSSERSGIPANSVLVFEIELVDSVSP